MIRFLDIRRHPEGEYHRENENRHVFLSLFFPMILVAIIWIVKLFELGSGIDLSRFGVFPRSVNGLTGILTAPLVHEDIQHAFANSVPLFVLGFLLYNAYRKVALKSVLLIWIISGIGIWLIGRPAYHIGASGLVFGMNFFLFFSGIFRLDMRSLALALLVAFAYGSMVWGIFPTEMHISYEAHAAGAASGILLAWIYRNVDRAPEVRWEEEDTAEAPGQNTAYPVQITMPGYTQTWSNPPASGQPGLQTSQQGNPEAGNSTTPAPDYGLTPESGQHTNPGSVDGRRNAEIQHEDRPRPDAEREDLNLRG